MTNCSLGFVDDVRQKTLQYGEFSDSVVDEQLRLLLKLSDDC